MPPAAVMTQSLDSLPVTQLEENRMTPVAELQQQNSVSEQLVSSRHVTLRPIVHLQTPHIQDSPSRWPFPGPE